MYALFMIHKLQSTACTRLFTLSLTGVMLSKGSKGGGGGGGGSGIGTSSHISIMDHTSAMYDDDTDEAEGQLSKSRFSYAHIQILS